MADSIPQIIWTAGPDGTAGWYNQRWFDLTGLPPNDPVSSEVAHGVVHPDDLPMALERWKQAVAAGGEYQCEVRLRRAADGQYRWHLARSSPMRDASGKILKWFGTSTDIHDQKTAEAQLAAANNAKDRFLAVLSHEMRTPLMPVLMTVQSLLNERGLTSEMVEGLEIILRNVELEARLIDDLLDLTRIARGKLQLNFDSVDLHEIVRRAMQICSIDIVGKKLTTTLDLSASKHHVRGDTARLQQVFWNLIKNAVKFTPQGGHVTIHSYDDPGGSIRVQVTDTGIGIDPDAIGRIFDAFEQADRSVTRQFGGLGLGLAITKALVDLHGGKLTANSPGTHRGSTFMLELRPSAPLAAPSQDDAPASDGRQPRPSRASIRILLVDDHPDTSRAMARLLQRMGYNVRTADTVRSALAVASEQPFDLLISDIGLPDGSGLELMKQLLTERPIKGIALSGFGMEEDIQRSKAAGFYEHLTKPINFKRLESAIADLTAT